MKDDQSQIFLSGQDKLSFLVGLPFHALLQISVTLVQPINQVTNQMGILGPLSKVLRLMLSLWHHSVVSKHIHWQVGHSVASEHIHWQVGHSLASEHKHWQDGHAVVSEHKHWQDGHGVVSEHKHWQDGHSVASEHKHWQDGHGVVSEHIHWQVGHSVASEHKHWQDGHGVVSEHKHWLDGCSVASASEQIKSMCPNLADLVVHWDYLLHKESYEDTLTPVEGSLGVQLDRAPWTFVI